MVIEYDIRQYDSMNPVLEEKGKKKKGLEFTAIKRTIIKLYCRIVAHLRFADISIAITFLLVAIMAYKVQYVKTQIGDLIC